jgi:hypothetical protein
VEESFKESGSCWELEIEVVSVCEIGGREFQSLEECWRGGTSRGCVGREGWEYVVAGSRVGGCGGC